MVNESFPKIYDYVVETLLEKNGLDRFIDDQEKLLTFLEAQKKILELLFHEKVDWKEIENFYSITDLQFAILQRFLHLFRKEFLKTNSNDALFLERMEILLELVAKVYIRKSIHFLYESKENRAIRELLLYRAKQQWIEKIIEAIEKDDFSLFPTYSANTCKFKEFLFYPQSLLICTEAASCAHLDELHTSLHRFAAEFYYLYTHKKFSQAYLIFRDLIDTYLQFNTLLTEFYFLTHSDLETSFFSLIEHYANSNTETYVILIDYHNLKRLNTIYGEANITQGMQQIEKDLDTLMAQEPKNYLYIKGSTANYYLLAIDKDESEVKELLQQFRKLTTSSQSVAEQEIDYTSFIGALKLSNSFPLTQEDITKMLLQLRQKAKEEKSGIKTAFTSVEFQNIYDWLIQKYRDTKYLEQKLAKKEFEVVFQPITMHGKSVYALETLIRIKEKEKLIPAYVFIDLLIELELVHKLDLITLEILENKLETIKLITSRLFLNTSFEALKMDEYLQKLESFIQKAKKNGLEVVIELTEQQLVEHTYTIKKLKTLDFLFAVDDFGSGYTSIRTVSDLAFERVIAFLKIDGSLVKELATKHELRQIVKAIADIAKAFDLFTIAEFVEDQTSINYLKQYGIDLLQGYYIARPQSIEALIAQKIKEAL